MEKMKIIKHRKGLKVHRIELYDNIDEIPIINFSQLEKNLIIESGVGASIQDFDQRLNHLTQFISTNHKDKALNEINNMRNLFWNVTNEIRPDMDAFSCLVESIDGEVVNTSDSGIERTTKKLKEIGFTKKMIDQRNEIKKKNG